MDSLSDLLFLESGETKCPMTSTRPTQSRGIALSVSLRPIYGTRRQELFIASYVAGMVALPFRSLSGGVERHNEW